MTPLKEDFSSCFDPQLFSYPVNSRDHLTPFGYDMNSSEFSFASSSFLLSSPFTPSSSALNSACLVPIDHNKLDNCQGQSESDSSPLSSPPSSTSSSPPTSPLTIGSDSPEERNPTEIVRVHSKKLVDISHLFQHSQRKAAGYLGIPNSTLNKKWRTATKNRKWPYRILNKLDKRIDTLSKNIPFAGADLFPSMVSELSMLINQRNEECKPLFITIK